MVKKAPKKATKRTSASTTRKTTVTPTSSSPAGRKPRAPTGAGALSLDEARAIVRAAQPQAKTMARMAALTGPSPATVGKERQRLHAEQRTEDKRRTDEYKATMKLLKKHGVRRAATKGAGTAMSKDAAAAMAPLQIFAEGDSWFDYPRFFGGGIVPRLVTLLGVPILNLAKAGDEVRYMLGVEQRRKLAETLKAGCPAGGSWDVLLFSGGGNDIVDNPMALWVRDWNPSVPPAQLLHGPRFDSALALVRAGYEDLIALRNLYSQSTHLVFHAYDFAIPDGRGVCNFGPWLKPTFDLRGFPDQKSASAVVREMLTRFAAMLQSLSAQPGVSFVNGQGLLPPDTLSWHNELHPSRSGFDAHAQLLHQHLKHQLPGRVLP